MQINAINTQNFKSNYAYGYNAQDADNIIEVARKFDETFKPTESKSVLGTIVSVGVSALLLFAVGKKGFGKLTGFTSSVLNDARVAKYTGAIKGFADKFVQKHQTVVAPAVKNVDKAIQAFKTNIINKVGASNLVGGVAAAVGTAAIAGTDSNYNGVADIAEKGVNAYKGTVQRLGVIGEVIDALS